VWNFLSSHKTFSLGALLLLAFVSAALLSPRLSPYDPVEQHMDQALRGLSFDHPLGTDELGRDVATRALCGARMLFPIVIWASLLPLLVGVPLGLVAGFYRRLGRCIDALTEIVLPFPELLLVILLTSLLGPGLEHALLALSVVFTPLNIRLIRSEVIKLRHGSFVLRLRASGVSQRRILWRHLLAHVFGTVLVQTSFNTGLAVASTAGLGYLGLGAQAPTSEWGVMLSASTPYFYRQPAMVAVHATLIVLASLTFHLLGEGTRDWLSLSTESLWNPFLRRAN
jgi:ABC-type dipeptide/oligopeptide/nickel transport system permease subunit